MPEGYVNAVTCTLNEDIELRCWSQKYPSSCDVLVNMMMRYIN